MKYFRGREEATKNSPENSAASEFALAGALMIPNEGIPNPGLLARGISAMNGASTNEYVHTARIVHSDYFIHGAIIRVRSAKSFRESGSSVCSACLAFSHPRGFRSCEAR